LSSKFSTSANTEFLDPILQIMGLEEKLARGSQIFNSAMDDGGITSPLLRDAGSETQKSG